MIPKYVLLFAWAVVFLVSPPPRSGSSQPSIAVNGRIGVLPIALVGRSLGPVRVSAVAEVRSSRLRSVLPCCTGHARPQRSSQDRTLSAAPRRPGRRTIDITAPVWSPWWSGTGMVTMPWSSAPLDRNGAALTPQLP